MFRKLVLLCFLIFCMFRFFLFSNATYASEPVPKIFILWNYCLAHFSQCKDEGLYNNPSDLEIKEEYLYDNSYPFKNKLNYQPFKGIFSNLRLALLDTINILWIGNGCNSDRILNTYQAYNKNGSKKFDMVNFYNKILFLRPGVVTNDRLCAG